MASPHALAEPSDLELSSQGPKPALLFSRRAKGSPLSLLLARSRESELEGAPDRPWWARVIAARRRRVCPGERAIRPPRVVGGEVGPCAERRWLKSVETRTRISERIRLLNSTRPKSGLCGPAEMKALGPIPIVPDGPVPWQIYRPLLSLAEPSLWWTHTRSQSE